MQPVKLLIYCIAFLLCALYAISVCLYDYPEKLDPMKIKLCVCSRYVPWERKTVQGMIHRGTSIFCNKKSIVNDYFILINLTIPAYNPTHNSIINTKLIEDRCDLVISVTSGRFTYEAYNQTNDRPLVAAIPPKIDILLIWSDKMLWLSLIHI